MKYGDFILTGWISIFRLSYGKENYSIFHVREQYFRFQYMSTVEVIFQEINMHSDFHDEILWDPYFLEENLGPEFQMLNIENSILHVRKSLSSFSDVKWKVCHSQARKSVSTFSYMKYTAIIFSVGIIASRFPYGQNLVQIQLDSTALFQN